MTATAASTLRLDLDGADLLGFSSRRDGRAGAKAAFVGIAPPTIANFMTSEAIASGAAATRIEPMVTVNDAESGAHERYTVSTTGFISGDQLTAGAPPPGGLFTCGSSPGYSNDPSSFPPFVTTSPATAADVTTFFDNLTFSSTATTPHPVTVSFSVRNDFGAAVTQTLTINVGAGNHAPVLGGLQASATAPPAASVVLQPNLTVTDPDANASATSAQVSITSGFTAGDRLTATPTAGSGIVATYNAATGVLTLTGAASDAAYQAALRTVSFIHDGAVSAGSRTVGFTVTDDQGAPSATATETVGVGGYSPPSPTPPAPTPTPSQQAGLGIEIGNLARAGAGDPALSDPTSPIFAQVQAEQAIAARLDAGQITLADAQSALFHLVDGTTSVAEIDYAFFTGKTPTAAGLNYLVHSSANATDLNDAYYQQFTTENRYINFAVNLATGAGAAAFQANYGSLSLSDATAKAYAAVFGIAPTADKVSAILNAQVSNGLGGTETRAQYLADITGGSAIAQKAAVVGFLLADSVKEGFGTYQQADLHFLQDLAHGTAAFNVDLLAAYTQAPSLVGQPAADPTLGA